MAYKEISASYVLRNRDIVPVVDVRPREMYEDGHIPKAVSVPLLPIIQSDGDAAENIAKRVKELGIEKDADLIIYCGDGTLAKQATELLESQGYTHIHCYLGGWSDWSSDKTRPVETQHKTPYEPLDVPTPNDVPPILPHQEMDGKDIASQADESRIEPILSQTISQAQKKDVEK